MLVLSLATAALAGPLDAALDTHRGDVLRLTTRDDTVKEGILLSRRPGRFLLRRPDGTPTEVPEMDVVEITVVGPSAWQPSTIVQVRGGFTLDTLAVDAASARFYLDQDPSSAPWLRKSRRGFSLGSAAVGAGAALLGAGLGLLAIDLGASRSDLVGRDAALAGVGGVIGALGGFVLGKAVHDERRAVAVYGTPTAGGAAIGISGRF